MIKQTISISYICDHCPEGYTFGKEAIIDPGDPVLPVGWYQRNWLSIDIGGTSRVPKLESQHYCSIECLLDGTDAAIKVALGVNEDLTAEPPTLYYEEGSNPKSHTIKSTEDGELLWEGTPEEFADLMSRAGQH